MQQFEFFSQVGQDKYIYENFFKNKENGIFLDIGAHDGIDKSNSYFFEKYLNWSGVCVEPIPDVFNRLKQNRKCTSINAGVSDRNGSAVFWRIQGYSEMLSGLAENYNEQHKQRIKKELKIHGGNLEEITIEIMDINTLMHKNNINHIDYCTIDVEGSEEKILSALDPKEIEISVLTVENNYNSETLRKLMKGKGYKLHSKVDFDDVYVRKRKKWFLWT